MKDYCFPDFWKGFINPTQEELEYNFTFNDAPIHLGKSDMYRAFDSDPITAWKYAFVSFTHFDLFWVYIHASTRHIPPKAFIKFLLKRFREDRYTSILLRRFGPVNTHNRNEYTEVFEKLLDNHPWDDTKNEDLNDFEITKNVSKMFDF